MWKKAEELLTFDILVLVLWIPLDKLPACLPLNQESQKHLIMLRTSHQRKVKTEVKCDCPVYRNSPKLC